MCLFPVDPLAKWRRSDTYTSVNLVNIDSGHGLSRTRHQAIT